MKFSTTAIVAYAAYAIAEQATEEIENQIPETPDAYAEDIVGQVELAAEQLVGQAPQLIVGEAEITPQLLVGETEVTPQLLVGQAEVTDLPDTEEEPSIPDYPTELPPALNSTNGTTGPDFEWEGVANMRGIAAGAVAIAGLLML